MEVGGSLIESIITWVVNLTEQLDRISLFTLFSWNMSLWDFIVILFGCGAIVEIMLGSDDGSDVLYEED